MSDATEPDSIRAALACVAGSEPFRNAPQLVAFLTFVIEKTLAGEAREIKGYTIATQALGRGESFDPQADPIVRVEAGRLRRALDAYYAGKGADDPIRIMIPRGAYVPHFTPQEPPPAAQNPAPAEPAAAPPSPLASPPPDVREPDEPAISRPLTGGTGFSHAGLPQRPAPAVPRGRPRRPRRLGARPCVLARG